LVPSRHWALKRVVLQMQSVPPLKEESMAEHASPQQTEEEYLAAERAKLHDDVLAAMRRARQAGMRGAYIDTSTLFAISQAILDSAVAADLRQQIAEARAKALEEAANVGYRECAQTRHVKLGDTVAASIRALAAGREG
jgi:hypothetical protein